MKLKLSLLIFLLFTTMTLVAQEKKKDPYGVRFIIGAGVHQEFSQVRSIPEKPGYNFLLGLGFGSFDLLGEIKYASYKRSATAKSTYGNTDYSQFFENYSTLAHLHYSLFRTDIWAPYIGILGGVSAINQSDTLIENRDSPQITNVINAGASAGIKLLPGSIFNIFIEARYTHYFDSYRPYDLKSSGLTGSWKKVEGDSQFLNSLNITGGATCSIF
jgi:hypothetical protein